MQALLHLIDTPENARRAAALCTARQCSIVHRTHGIELDEDVILEGGFTINFGGYGSYSRIGLGPTFRNRWQLSGVEEPRQQSFAQLSVYFAGSEWVRPLSEQTELVSRGGGVIADTVDAAAIVVLGKNTPAPAGVPETALVIDEMVFHRALPAVRTAKTSKTTRSKALTGEAAALWKLLSLREESAIRQGLVLAFGLEEGPSELLAGVEVNPDTGELIRNKRFTGTGPAQPFLDAALYGLLSIAPDDTPAAALRSSVRKIDCCLPFMIELTGFDALTELTLRLDDEFKADDLLDFGPFPSLQRLTIQPRKEDGGYWGGNWPQLASLEGLNAPALEVVTVSKVDLQNCESLLQCSQLTEVDLSNNRNLTNINGLSQSVSTLKVLLMRDCVALASLEPLAGATALEVLNLYGCAMASVTVLASSPNIRVLELENCSQLTSLQGLAHLTLCGEGGQTYDLTGCDALTSLEGLPKLDKPYEYLNISYLTALDSLTGIENAVYIDNLNASGTAITDLSPLLALEHLREVDLSGCEALQDASPLGQLKQLQSADLSNCSALTTLPAAWSSELEGLNLEGCSALRSLGGLPASLSRISRYSWRAETVELGGLNALESLQPLAATALAANSNNLNLSGCHALSSLAGLEGFDRLESLTLSPALTDARAVAGCRGLAINVELSGQTVVPAALMQTLAQLPRLTLGLLLGDELEDFSALALAPQMESLNLYSCKLLKDLSWLVGLSELRDLFLSPNCPAAKQLKASKLDSQVRIRKAQQQLCSDLGLPLPAHLGKAAGGKSTAKKRPTGGLSLKELKPLLTSPDVAEVNKGLARLQAEGDAALFDELTEDCDPDQAFSGDSQAIGKLFKAVKAANRPLARWALASILAMAPAEASHALSVRSAMREITLGFDEFAEGAAMPSLSGFTALEKVALSACPATSLACLSGLTALRELELRGAPALTTLQGLEAASRLESLTLRDCPQLLDLAALAGKNRLANQGNLDLSGTAPLQRLDFLCTFTPPESLELMVTATTDLSPLHEQSAITSLTLHCLDTLPDLSPLIHVQTLEYYREKPPSPKKAANVWPFTAVDDDEEDDTPPPLLHWAYTLPKLATLAVNGGAHDFSGLVAPALKTFNSWGRWSQGRTVLDNLRGLAQIEDFTFWSSSIASLDGLQGSPVKELNLGSLEGRLENPAALAEMPHLRRLTLPSDQEVLNHDALQALPPLPELESLTLQGYSGSLAFLAGWTGLQTLDLQQSGAMTDLETLIALPALETIMLRGAHLKRNAWPEALQGKLEYVRSS
jgi:internalin A